MGQNYFEKKICRFEMLARKLRHDDEEIDKRNMGTMSPVDYLMS